MDAIPAILDLFKTYQVVGLGEGPHGNLEGAAFRLKLLRDPRFPTVVNDILVESGTARYLIERTGIKMVTISVRYGELIKIQPSVASWKIPSFAPGPDGRRFARPGRGGRRERSISAGHATRRIHARRAKRTQKPHPCAES